MEPEPYENVGASVIVFPVAVMIIEVSGHHTLFRVRLSPSALRISYAGAVLQIVLVHVA